MPHFSNKNLKADNKIIYFEIYANKDHLQIIIDISLI